MRNLCQSKRNAEAPPHSRHGTPSSLRPRPEPPDPPLRALCRYHPVTPPGPDTPPANAHRVPSLRGHVRIPVATGIHKAVCDSGAVSAAQGHSGIAPCGYPCCPISA